MYVQVVCVYIFHIIYVYISLCAFVIFVFIALAAFATTLPPY